MKLVKINIILILFLILTVAMLSGAWIFINSSSFSDDLSKKISDVLLDKSQVVSSFTKVDFVAFPPKTIIHNLKLKKEVEGVFSIDLEFKKVVVDFSLVNVLSKKLELSAVELSQGRVDIRVLNNENTEVDYLKINLKKYFSLYQDYVFNKSPVLINKIKGDGIRLNVDNHLFEIDSFSSMMMKKSLRAKANLYSAKVCLNTACTNDEKIKSFEFNSIWNKDGVQFLNLDVSHKIGRFSGHLDLSNNESGLLVLKGKSRIQAKMYEGFKYLQKILPELGDFKGLAKVDVVFDGVLSSLFKEASIVVEGLESNWLDLDQLNTKVVQKNGSLVIERFEGKKANEFYRLSKPADFFNLKKRWFKEGSYFLLVKNSRSNNFLQAVPSLVPMKIMASGPVKVEYVNKKVFFDLNGVVVDELKLEFKDSKVPLIESRNYQTKNFQLIIDSQFNVFIQGKISDGQNVLAIAGKITSKDIDVKILPSSMFSWDRFGAIAGVKIRGEGKTEGTISGPLDDVVFSFAVDWQKFEVVNIKFGNVKGAFDFSIQDLSLGISSLQGESFGNKYSGHGMLYFGERSGMDVDLKIDSATYLNLIQMLPLIFRNLPMPTYVDFLFNGAVKLSGPFESSKMKAEGFLRGTDGSIKGERFDNLELKFLLKENQLEFNDILLKKFKAIVSAWVSISLENGFMEFRGKSAGLYLNDLDFYRNLRLGYQGKLDFDFEGNGTPDTLSSKYKLRLTEASIANMSMPGASAVAFFNGKEVAYSGNILGNRIRFESLLNFEDKLSSIKFKIDTNEIKDILGILSSHNLNSTKITGKLKGVLDVVFDLGTMSINKFLLNIQDFVLKKDQMFLKNDVNKSLVSIENGIVRRWNVRLIGNDDTFVESKGYAQTNGDIRIDNGFKFDASVFELFSPFVERSLGFFNGKNTITIGKGLSVRDLEISSEKIFLKLKELKTPISDIRFKIKKINTDFVLQKFMGILGEGEVRADGKFVFDQMIPKIALNYQIDKATIPLFKKTVVTFNSTGELSGVGLPYLLKGKLNILHGESLDDPADFLDNKKINLNAYSNYLPSEQGANAEEILSLNMQFDIVNPFIVKNNLAEVYVKGAGSVNSTLRSPELNLRLEAVPGLSKFKFKGNDFSITQGYVDIRDQGKVRQSDVRFIGITRLNDYDLKLEIAGKVDKVSINLASEPPLAQEDLLSLLTLGVTNDISKNLDSNDRKFVTTVGLGTLLVDQFKINEDLNSTLGLKLSVLPEFQENETQLIQGKSAISDTNSSRLKSSTKIKLDKKITKQVDLSVSSTVGGSLEQKQEMNLNFNIDRNWSVEGVYELKSTDTDEGNSTNSVGADVKYKWSF